MSDTSSSPAPDGTGGGGGDAESLPVQAATTETPKVTILLKPVANAPIIAKTKWVVDGTKTIAYVAAFVRKFLKLTDPGVSLFFWVNQAFAPAPDQTIANLYECFGAERKLVLHYSVSEAWG